METALQVIFIIAIPSMAISNLIHFWRIKNGKAVLILVVMFYLSFGVALPYWFYETDDGNGGMALLGVILILSVALPFLLLILLFALGLFRFSVERRNGLHKELGRFTSIVRSISTRLGAISGMLLFILFPIYYFYGDELERKRNELKTLTPSQHEAIHSSFPDPERYIPLDQYRKLLFLNGDTVSSNSNEEKVDYLSLITSGDIHYLNSLVFSGSTIEYNVNGDTLRKTQFVKGLKHGAEMVAGDLKGQKVFRKYHWGYLVSEVRIDSSGQKRSEKNYSKSKKGKLHGSFRKWASNGQLTKIWSYENGMPNGECNMWYQNGHSREELNYHLGKPHGTCRYFHENGEVKSEQFYDFGEPIGVWKDFDENGSLISTKKH